MAIDEGRISIDNTIDNTSTNLIQITEDKLENILTRHVARIQKSKDLVGAAGLFISLIGMWLTTEFRSALGMSAETWQGIFIGFLFFSILYLLYVIWNCFKYRSGVKQIIRDIKNEA